MLLRIGRTIYAWRHLLLVVALCAGLPSCANRKTTEHNPAADDLDWARSDFDRHTPPGGD
jgi:hypothetical protein